MTNKFSFQQIIFHHLEFFLIKFSCLWYMELLITLWFKKTIFYEVKFFFQWSCWPNNCFVDYIWHIFWFSKFEYKIWGEREQEWTKPFNLFNEKVSENFILQTHFQEIFDIMVILLINCSIWLKIIIKIFINDW